MADNETHVIYKALADFSSLRKEARKAKKEFAELKAAEEAFNAASGKNLTAATNAAKARNTALSGNKKAYDSAAAAMVKQLAQVRAATKAIQAQNRALGTNSSRLLDSAVASEAYAAAQRKIARNTGKTNDKTAALRNEVQQLNTATAATNKLTTATKKETAARQAASKAAVKFVEDVGEVNTATGEVTKPVEQATASTNGWANAIQKVSNVLKGNSAEAEKNARLQGLIEKAHLKQSDAAEALRVAEMRLSEVMARSGPNSAATAAAELRVARARRNLEVATIAARNAVANFNRDGGRMPPILNRIASDGERARRALVRFGNWRPRLIPPFVALVPIIGAVIAALNPLVALIGSAGPVVLGFAGSLGSLSGALFALPGILGAVVGGIASLIASMGGVGTVFKTYSAMNKAMGKAAGTRGETQAERAEKLADAERNLARAQRSVQKAQENLNKARQRALKNLIELREEVGRASLNEERAIADLQLAREAYNNVMADPGSTLGDKLDAAARIKEAEAELQEVRKNNIENAAALQEAERRGIEQSEEVLDAQEDLRDAYERQADAGRELEKVRRGETAATSAAATAVDEYNDALNKLSPSARAVVLALIALQDEWEAMKKTVQEAFFSEFVGDMDRLPRLIETLGTVLRPTASAMGEFVSKFLTLMDSPEWSRDLAKIGGENGKVLSLLGDAFLYMMTTVKDLMLAAAPFTEWMVTGFAEGNKRFSEMVASARETGSLANWLSTVGDRMQTWWAIIKNIAKTLFNYSAASSAFGDWLTDGLLKLTEGWKRASQEARRDGSPWQQYLENVKPLLTEVKSLFASFFGWFRRESMEVGNIESATNLLQILRTQVGPALADIMDTLADSNIDEQFLHAIARLIEFVDSIMKAGGNTALQSFFDVLTGFFDGVSQFFSALPPGSLAMIGTFFGTLAALSFIGKFPGVQLLFKGILGLVPQAAKLGGIFGGLAGLSKLKFTGLLAAVAAVAALPEITSTVGDAWRGIFGIDMSSFDKALSEAAKAKSVTGGRNLDAYKANEFNQSRNLVFDGGRNLVTGDAAWQKVDDELRRLIASNDVKGFQAAWRKVTQEVGDDAAQIWSLTAKDAKAAGIQLEDTGTKVRNLGQEAEDAKVKIEGLKDGLRGVNSGAITQTQAFDDLAASIQSLNQMPPVSVDGILAQTDEARALRDSFIQVETNAKNAALAILDNGGSVEAAQAKYDEGRSAIETYMTNMGMAPEKARAMADGIVGPAGDVAKLFTDIKTEMDKIETDKKIKISILTDGGWLGGSRDSDVTDSWGNPTTMVNGKEVVNFGAMPKGNKGGTAAPNKSLASNLNIGLNDKIEEETKKSNQTWRNFWGGFNQPVNQPLANTSAGFARMSTEIKNNGLDPLNRNTKGTFNDMNQNGINPFRTMAALLPSQFSGIVNGIASAWDKLRAAFRDPISFIVNTVYTKGIQAIWNPVNDALKLGMRLPDRSFATGGVLPGYTPGRDVHQFVSPTGGRLALSGGEAIMRPEFTRMVGGEKGVEELNRKARRGEAFASGGVWGKGDGFGMQSKPGTGGLFEIAGDIWDKFRSFIQGPGDYIKNGLNRLIKGGIDGIFSQFGDSNFVKMAAAIPKNMVDKLTGFGTEKVKGAVRQGANDMSGGGPAPSNVMGWQSMWQAVKNAFPGASLNSAYRPGAITSTGSLSYHGSGRAIDVTPSMSIFNWIKDNFPNSRELIYSPAGSKQLQNGRERYWPEPVRSQHFDHVHWAYRKGGVFNKMKGTHDNGGWLPNGMAALNLTGKPEAVLTPEESRGLKAMLSGQGLIHQPPMALPGQASNIAAQAPQIVDNSVNIEHLTISNAVPEKASQSLPKSLRQIGYMQNARDNA